MNFLTDKRIHFIGAGGIGVNALAAFALDCGAIVSGSDRKLNRLTAQLAAQGAQIYGGENDSVVDSADIVVFSSAIREDNGELVRARELGKTVLERHEFLGFVASHFGKVIAIGGTHGKTTVTAMLTHILRENGASFISMIGGEANGMGHYVNTLQKSQSGYSDDDFAAALFVSEACEYRRSLLSLHPDVAVITNMECDHPDCYKTKESLEEVFALFASQSKTLIAPCGLYQRLLCSDCEQSIYADMSYSANEKRDEFCIRCAQRYYKYSLLSDGAVDFDFNGEQSWRGTIAPRGDFNIENALYAVAAACECGIACKAAAKALGCFKGVARRMEYVGKINGKPAYFDFAHHPTEIRRVLNLAREQGRVLAVFQPHTYSRTKAYMDDFVSVLALDNGVEELVVMPTYAAREKETNGADSAALVYNIISRSPKKHVYLTKNAPLTFELVEKLSLLCDVIMFIGAGDIYELRSRISTD